MPKAEKSKKEKKSKIQLEREQLHAFYVEQLRRYMIARPDWRTAPAGTFWANYGEW